MMMVMHCARRLGQFGDTDADRVSALLLRANLPVSGPAKMAAEDYFPHMMRDKKSSLATFVWYYR